MIKVTEVKILKEAVVDLNNGKSFCDNQKNGLGNYFWNSIIKDIESITTYAGIHKKYLGLYQMFSEKFPYSIYYYTSNKNAFVVAILPMKIDPNRIERILLNRR